MTGSSEQNGVVLRIEQADADANVQRAISRLHPFLVKLILSNPITSKKMGNYKPDFNQSLQAIIDDWSLFFPPGSKFAYFQNYFRRAIWVRNFVAHQSFDCNRYQHSMESLAQVATAIGESDLAENILKEVAIEDGNNTVNVSNEKENDWEFLKQKGNQLYKEKKWTEAMNCFTRAIHLNQEEAALYSNRALCEFRLSKFDLAREDIEDAIQLNPENVIYFRFLSKVLLKMKKYQESLEACMQGLTIDPRDEVLIVRERDCRALLVPVKTDQPVLGKSISVFGRDFRLAVLPNPNILHMTSEDIENCDYDKFCECSNLSESLEKAHQFELAATLDGEKEALKIYVDAAKKGFAYGLFNIAKFYCEGKAGLPRNFQKAIKYCRKAASQKPFIRNLDNIRRNDINVLPNVGVADAENFLGDCYRDGRGVEQCRAEAFQWYLKAARHNSLTGQNNVALALLNGDGCKVDEISARSWFQKAADYGHAEAQYNYAIMLEEGLGGPMDVKKAGEMLKLAVDQDHAGALERLQKLSRSGALGALNMDQTQDNLCKKALTGDPVSQYFIGLHFLNGTGGFPKDLEKAELFLKVASDCGYPDAHLPLGKLLLDLKKNEEAFEIFKLSAEKGSADGQLELGLLLNYGHGCDRDETQARRWFNRAKMQGVTFKLTPDGKLRGHDEWVEEMIELGRKQCEFETKNHLNHEGLSLEDRIRRFDKSQLDLNDPDQLRYLEYLNVTYPPGGRRSRSPSFQRKAGEGITPEVLNELKPLAENGSITAQFIINSRKILECAKDLFEQKRTKEAFKLFRLSLRNCTLLHSEFTKFYGQCYRTAKEVLDENPQDADALYVLTKFCINIDGIETSWKAWDSNSRLPDGPIFLARNGLARSNEERLQMAKRCVELDPSVPDFHYLVADLCNYVADYQNGLRAVERAIELLPSQTGWLYDRANFICRLSNSQNYTANYAAEPYLKFLSSNPADHHKVPLAYYHLAYIYVSSENLTKAKVYFQKGLEAEDPSNPDRLPCFFPVEDDFFAKRITRTVLKARVPLEETDCANCLRGNRTLWCTVCKSVRYCNRECQVAHKKEHKANCKRANPRRLK